MTNPNKASDEQIALVRKRLQTWTGPASRAALTAVLDDHKRMSDELERYRKAFETPVGWLSHHDIPMYFPEHEEAWTYCDDDESPIPVAADPFAPQQGDHDEQSN